MNGRRSAGTGLVLAVFIGGCLFLAQAAAAYQEDRQMSGDGQRSEEGRGLKGGQRSEERHEPEESGLAGIWIDRDQKYQMIEDFGASGCWWSQDVGGWDEPMTEEEDAPEVREYVARLLFSPEEGIGLSSYRYNIGAGSGDSGNSRLITDPWRATECFETAPGEYDWDRDANAVWFLKKAADMGVYRVVLFANSPPERMTVSGNAYGAKGSPSNLDPSHYADFSRYLLDVAEHFLEEGIPVAAVSPVNEPQWDWTDSGQEGCHFEPKELAAFLNVFCEELSGRKALRGVEAEMPELGEWGNTSFLYLNTLKKETRLLEAADAWCIHSYWSDRKAKESFMNWQAVNGMDRKLRMSEWCEMVNGKDITMDSALTLAQQVYEDLTIQNVVSWQYWIGVSCYDYRDGLIYVDKESHGITPAKRLWALGNYSRFVRPGYVRVACGGFGEELKTTAFFGTEDGEERLVLVVVNPGRTAAADGISELMRAEGFQKGQLWVTDADHDLELTKEWGAGGPEADAAVLVPEKSVVTFVFE